VLGYIYTISVDPIIKCRAVVIKQIFLHFFRGLGFSLPGVARANSGVVDEDAETFFAGLDFLYRLRNLTLRVISAVMGIISPAMFWLCVLTTALSFSLVRLTM